jgi:hypothetical protein
VRAFLRELCSAIALCVFMLGLATVSTLIVEQKADSQGITVAEAAQ